MAARFATVVVMCAVALGTASAAQMPFSPSVISQVAGDLARTAAEAPDFGRQLHQASTSGGSGMLAGLSGLQGLAGSAAASNSASNTGASAAAAVSSAVQSLGQQLGSKVSSVSDVQQQLEQLLLQFCSKEEYTAPAQVPASWTGSSATIALVPHTCLIHPENNTLACSPAQLVLYKTAGSYNKAYTSAASWTGKECKIQQQLGSGSTQVIGGAPYTVDIPQPVQFKSLWTPIFPNGAPAPAPEAGGAAAAASTADSSGSDPSGGKPSGGKSGKPSSRSGSKPTKKKPTKKSSGGSGTSASTGSGGATASGN